jgi:hypothetical protein
MSERIQGGMERVDVGVATFDLRISPENGQREAFRSDPEGFMRRFLEEQGFNVNRLQFIHTDRYRSAEATASDEPEEEPMPMRSYHIEYPEESGWICCCSD